MSQGFFTSGYLVEDRERAPVDTLEVLPDAGARFCSAKSWTMRPSAAVCFTSSAPAGWHLVHSSVTAMRLN